MCEKRDFLQDGRKSRAKGQNILDTRLKVLTTQRAKGRDEEMERNVGKQGFCSPGELILKWSALSQACLTSTRTLQRPSLLLEAGSLDKTCRIIPDKNGSKEPRCLKRSFKPQTASIDRDTWKKPKLFQMVHKTFPTTC